jgi:hypothetical protein
MASPKASNFSVSIAKPVFFIGPCISQLGLPKQWSGVSMFVPKRMLCFSQ